MDSMHINIEKNYQMLELNNQANQSAVKLVEAAKCC